MACISMLNGVYFIMLKGLYFTTDIVYLQEQLAKKVDEDGRSSRGSQIEQLLQSHQNEVDHLQGQMAAAREQQERVLREKLQAKRLKRER